MSSKPRPDVEGARSLWRIADDLRAQAFEKEVEARRLRNKAAELSSFAAAIADGRVVEE